MKTPEEWVKGKLIFQVDKTQPDENWIEIVKQIQLDAWKQGMTDAAYIIDKEIMKTKNGLDPKYQAINPLYSEILTSRDNKTEI